MIPVKVAKISYRPSDKNYYVILKEIRGDKYLSLNISHLEAQSIALILESVDTIRPMHHDLICNLLNNFDLLLKKICITDFKDGLFKSYLEIKTQNNDIKKVEARPSDAIAIALRANSTILISKKMMLNDKIEHENFIQYDFKDRRPKISIKKLKNNLKIAVNDENYEIAAKIRDKIKKLES